MKLYYTPVVCSLAPHIVLCEGDFDFTLVKVDLPAKKTESGKDFYAINPKGYVPVLELPNGERLTEVPAILQYLGDQSQGLHLMPTHGGMEHYRAVEWLGFINSEIHKSFTPFFSKLGDQAWDYYKGKLRERFDLLEKHLQSNDFMLGEHFSAVDAYLFTVLNWTKPAQIDLTSWPKLSAFHQRIAERPAVQKAMQAEGTKANAA